MDAIESFLVRHLIGETKSPMDRPAIAKEWAMQSAAPAAAAAAPAAAAPAAAASQGQ